jgi:hypothetical protein
MRQTAQLGAVLAVLLLATGCGSAQTSPSAQSKTMAAKPTPTVKPAPTIPIAAGLALKGTESMSGKPATLKGDYVLEVSVRAKGKAKCRWSVRLDGLDDAVLATYPTRAGGTYRTSVDLVGVVQGPYRLVVKASKCGAWSVKLKRP